MNIHGVYIHGVCFILRDFIIIRWRLLETGGWSKLFRRVLRQQLSLWNLDNPLSLSLIFILCAVVVPGFEAVWAESERMAAGSAQSSSHPVPFLLRGVRAQAGSSGIFTGGSWKPPRTEAAALWAPIPSSCQCHALNLSADLPFPASQWWRIHWEWCDEPRSALFHECLYAE